MVQILLYPDGSWEEIVLGPEVDKGQVPQKLIPANTWMGFVKKEDPHYDWGLYGVMVVPGWHIEDIRMVKGEKELAALREKYPTAVKTRKRTGAFLKPLKGLGKKIYVPDCAVFLVRMQTQQTDQKDKPYGVFIFAEALTTKL